MRWPEFFDFSVHVHEDEFLPTDLVFQALRKFCHVLIGVEDDKLHLFWCELELVRNAPLPFVGVVDELSIEKLCTFE